MQLILYSAEFLLTQVCCITDAPPPDDLKSEHTGENTLENASTTNLKKTI